MDLAWLVQVVLHLANAREPADNTARRAKPHPAAAGLEGRPAPELRTFDAARRDINT